MMNQVVLLEGVVPSEILAAIVLILIGLLGLWQGWVAYTKPISRFVINYRGWPCHPRHVLRGCRYVAHVIASVQTASTSNRCGSDRTYMGVLHIDLFDRFLLVSPIPPPPLAPPSCQSRRPTQRPQRHGSFQSSSHGAATRSSPARKPTVRR